MYGNILIGVSLEIAHFLANFAVVRAPLVPLGSTTKMVFARVMLVFTKTAEAWVMADNFARAEILFFTIDVVWGFLSAIEADEKKQSAMIGRCAIYTVLVI